MPPAGQPIKIVTLGGSVTFGHGPREPANVWINQLYTWINETFPHPKHQLINHAIPAVKPRCHAAHTGQRRLQHHCHR